MADPESSLREIAHTRTPFSAWLGVTLLFLIFGAIVLAIVGPSPRGDDYEQKRAKARAEKLKTLHDEETKALTTYGWIDKTKGTVRVPIERAMELALVDLSRKKPAAAGPVATAAPAPEASPAAGQGKPAPTPAGPGSPTPAPIASPTPTGTPKPKSVSGPESEARGQPAAAINPPPAPVASATPSPTASPSPAQTPP